MSENEALLRAHSGRWCRACVTRRPEGAHWALFPCLCVCPGPPGTGHAPSTLEMSGLSLSHRFFIKIHEMNL